MKFKPPQKYTEDIPTITPEMIAETNAEIAKRRGDRTESPLKQIKNARCSICGLDKVSFADDLTFETTRDGKPTVIHGLSGLRCSNCGDIAFDSNASKIIAELTGKT